MRNGTGCSLAGPKQQYRKWHAVWWIWNWNSLHFSGAQVMTSLYAQRIFVTWHMRIYLFLFLVLAIWQEQWCFLNMFCSHHWSWASIITKEISIVNHTTHENFIWIGRICRCGRIKFADTLDKTLYRLSPLVHEFHLIRRRFTSNQNQTRQYWTGRQAWKFDTSFFGALRKCFMRLSRTDSENIANHAQKWTLPYLRSPTNLYLHL